MAAAAGCFERANGGGGGGEPIKASSTGVRGKGAPSTGDGLTDAAGLLASPPQMLTGFTHFMSSSTASCWTTILFLLALWQLMPMERRRLFCAAAPLERRGGEFTENSLMAKEEAQQRHNNHDRHGQRTAAMKYLQEFGYLTTPIPTPAEVRNALLVFQDMAGLPNTGELDEPTLEEMQQPRCGNDDLSRAAQRRKRFVYISRWEDKVKDGELRLKWFLQNYTPDMAREDIRKTVRQAFQIWSSQVRIQAMESLSLVFEEANTEEEADIIILWAEGDHGDAHMFDGPGEDGSNILAHTFYPNYQSKGSLNGDIHLDDYEQWHVNSSGKSGGASFPHVLVHEIGHTLGLGHSKKQQAIMFPIYRKERLDQMQLDMDDKCAINWSYVGASDLCLYIWLLSEVLPKRVAPVAEQTSSDKQLSSNMLQQDVWEPVDALKAQLAGRRMPECGTDAEDRMRVQLAELLRRRLSFPQEMAEPYADVLCRFFDGFRQEFGLAGTRHLHRVIRPVGAHSYWQPNDNFAALEQALDRERRRPFDSDFFARLMAMFMGTALSSPVASSR